MSRPIVSCVHYVLIAIRILLRVARDARTPATLLAIALTAKVSAGIFARSGIPRACCETIGSPRLIPRTITIARVTITSLILVISSLRLNTLRRQIESLALDGRFCR